MGDIKALKAEDHIAARDLAFSLIDDAQKGRAIIPSASAFTDDDRSELERKIVLLSQEVAYLRNVNVTLRNGIGLRPGVPDPDLAPAKKPDPVDARTLAVKDLVKRGASLEDASDAVDRT